MTDINKKLSRPEAAAYIGVTTKTLGKWAWSGDPWIPYYRIGRKTVYALADLDRFLASRRLEKPADRETVGRNASA